MREREKKGRKKRASEREEEEKKKKIRGKREKERKRGRKKDRKKRRDSGMPDSIRQFLSYVHNDEPGAKAARGMHYFHAEHASLVII